jgi:hypothetical protein
MIICVCRNIKESDFETRKELIERIMQCDHNCGQCQQYCKQTNELLELDADLNLY